MSDPNGWSSSDSSNTLQLTPSLHFSEKGYLTGILIGAILYGVSIVMFLRCMATLLRPVHCAREAIRWGLVVYVLGVFSLVTIGTATGINILFICFIENREFPGIGDVPPGPSGYLSFIYSRKIFVVSNLTFFMNNWLADGVLLYRGYIIYAMNYSAIAFPCMMYLASLATGVIFIYDQASQPTTEHWSSVATNFNYPYFAISLSLNVLLTVMIITRLVLRSRDIRNSMGGSARTTGMYKAVLTLLIESSALYALTYLLFIIPWAAGSPVANIFSPILVQAQVIAPFLIILRIANRSALTSDLSTFGDYDSTHLGSRRESLGMGEILSDGSPAGSTDAHEKSPGELGIEVETTVSVYHD